jgi:hypothetical protein
VIGSAFLRDREGNLSCASRRSLPAQAWFVERITRPDKSRIVGMIGSGKNIIASPKRLQPLASRPQVRTFGAIIYFDVLTPSGVCFNSFYLSCWPKTFEFINLAPPVLRIRCTSRRQILFWAGCALAFPLSRTQRGQMEQRSPSSGERKSFPAASWHRHRKSSNWGGLKFCRAQRND